MIRILLVCIIVFASCSSRSSQEKDDLITSIQLIDRNGFSETISNPSRLKPFQSNNFLSPQPYQRILRVYGRDLEGKIRSRITSYHPNGHIWRYLEIMDGRANGLYKEWHANGRPKLEVTVIEGMADFNEVAQLSWVFDGTSTVWDEEGHQMATFSYEKGLLEGTATYYHPSGSVWKTIPYVHNLIDGTFEVLDEKGQLLERVHYSKGEREGIAIGHWPSGAPQFEETYEQGLLIAGKYFSTDNQLLAEVKEKNGFQILFKEECPFCKVTYQNGLPEGRIEVYQANGTLQRSYHVKAGKKQGEEIIYFPESSQPQLSLFWNENAVQGVSKTWYMNGNLESQREMRENKKQGLSFAWYRDGQLMLVEEYEQDRLLKGSYFKKGDKDPVSKIENGKGIATLFDAEGFPTRKVQYEKGRPLDEEK